MDFIELFAGIGGFRLGLENSGHECVWANEWDRHAADIYDHNFGGQIDRRDITTIPSTEIPDHDILTGGFPCQAFSIAGKRAGFDDTRGTLFFEIARILRDKTPRYFLLENVKGLLSHNNGETFQAILRVLANLGYQCEWVVFNSKDFGVPQNRERVFIAGHLRGQSAPKILLNRKTNAKTIQQLNDPKHSNDRIYSLDGLSPTLNTMQGGNRQPFIPVLTPDRLIKRQNGRRFKTDGEPSFTLNTQDRHGVYDGFNIRRLTPLECERLQGFPDGWTSIKSDTQRYKTLGNAVTVNVVEALSVCFGEETNNENRYARVS